jgi:tRNA G46 methylase TrmB
VRQHVNPLRREFQQPASVPDWAAVFADPSLPLALDIGSGYGRFLLLLQRNNPEQRVNYLGLEIRRPVGRASHSSCGLGRPRVDGWAGSGWKMDERAGGRV